MVQNATQVKLRIFHSGYCVAHGKVADPVRGQKYCRFYATWALIEHPKAGLILFDTGYAPRFREATARWPYKLYAWMTPMFLQEEETACNQLTALGYDPAQIGMVILSHFHGDHIAGLKDFPNARIVCSTSALEQATSVKGWAAVNKGILPDLLPLDLIQRAQTIDDHGLGKLTDEHKAYDLWGDGSIHLFALPGHGRGQMGAVVQTPDGSVFLAADAAWQLQAWQFGTLPRSIVRLFFDDWLAYRQTFDELRGFAQRNPECRIVFTHSPELVKPDEV